MSSMSMGDFISPSGSSLSPLDGSGLRVSHEHTDSGLGADQDYAYSSERYVNNFIVLIRIFFKYILYVDRAIVRSMVQINHPEHQLHLVDIQIIIIIIVQVISHHQQRNYIL